MPLVEIFFNKSKYALFLEMINIFDIYNDHILAATLITLFGLFKADEETDDHI